MKTKTNLQHLFFAAALCVSGWANAQETTTTTVTTTTTTVEPNYDQGFRLGFGISPGYMLDDPFNNLALGGDVRLQYDFSKRISVTLTTGYDHFFIDKDVKDLPGFCDVGMIPVKAGFKGFWWKDHLYAMGEAGAGFVTSKGFPSNSPVSDRTNIILSPSIGWANKWFDVSVRYEHYTELETGQVALRFAYGFRL